MSKRINKTATAFILLASLAQVGCVMECDHKSHDGGVRSSDHVVSDSAITTAIKSKFFTDPEIEAARIHVKTVNSVVTLTGSVPTITMRDLAISIAKETEGVRRVQSKLKII